MLIQSAGRKQQYNDLMAHSWLCDWETLFPRDTEAWLLSSIDTIFTPAMNNSVDRSDQSLNNSWKSHVRTVPLFLVLFLSCSKLFFSLSWLSVWICCFFVFANELALIMVNLRVYRHQWLQCCNRTLINNANKTYA